MSFVLWWMYQGGSYTHCPEVPPNASRQGAAPLYQDKNLNYTIRELLHFDIDYPAYWPVSPSVSITETLSICHYSYAWNVTGHVKLAPGDPDQQYNFMVGMDIRGSSQMAIDSVVWPIHSNINAMYIRCVEFQDAEEANADWDATVVVDVTVFVKPHTLQFGQFRVGTDYLDIEIAEGLTFETYDMQLYSGRGSVRGEEIGNFTAHELSVVSGNGSITGTWSLPRKIELRTGGWDFLDQLIDIDLVPKISSAGPTTQGILSATTQGGDINIRMPLQDNLSLRNMSINVNTQLGSISGTFVTGYITSLTTISGSIDATLLPYFQLRDSSSLTTSTSAGYTKVRVLPPIIDKYYQINPLKNTKSDHSTTSGLLELIYPQQWAGAALGLSETGTVVVEGERLKTILQEDHLVVARTDDEIASRLDFSTTTGYGKLIVE